MVLNPRSSVTDIVKAALAALAGMTVLGMFIVFLGGHDFFSSYTQYQILFNNVKDLTSGRPVKYAGLSVGKVDSIMVDPGNPGRISVVINVDQDFPLYEGTVATVTQKGLVGDNYILLQLSGEAGPKLGHGDRIPVAVTMSMNEVAAEMGKSIAALVPQLEKALGAFELLFSPENMSNIGKSLKMAPEILAETNATLVSFRNEWKNLSRSGSSAMKSGAKNLTVLTAEVADTLQKVESVLHNLEVQLSSTLKNVDGQVVRAVDSVESLTADLRENIEYDQEELAMILMNINRLSREMSRLARSLRERPWQVLNPPQGAENDN
ncbi:MlaD family protein [Maridesulfovibrio hydrothermalis]|uniref:Mammalian cell entry related domain protein n=1 Tax=Maridesulfovibrio hydrothermalis AM13 = DSM 14728 TaxID=1121451 RepID=L0R8C9_9BACT|nr:MlaD family protein [Maridesulfovibrio hydrothermalis]CCO23004.1 Mammalian cell entry related domain protein [Maridesulfovibrio hydrothermalis AM13 = DSM 14728]